MKEKDTSHTDLQPIALPEPRKEGGKTVLASLWERKSNRNLREEQLPPQVLSDLLWAAFGVNRESGPMGRPGRTAPSGMNLQGVDVYVANTDIEIHSPPGTPPPERPMTVAMYPCFGEVDAGFIGQNVYLLCASEDLAAWFYSTDREGLAKALHLRPAQKMLYCQAVGYSA